MTNYNPAFTSSAASGSFYEDPNSTGSSTLHVLSGTLNFKDQNHSDTHTTTTALKSVSWSGGSGVPPASLSDFSAALSSQILTDSNGTGKLKWTFSAEDEAFDFLAKNETLVLTYEVFVADNHGGVAKQTVKVTVKGTDDRPVIEMATVAMVDEQTDQTLSFSPDTAAIALQFVDPDLNNVGHTASVIGVDADGVTTGLLPGFLGTLELLSFYHVDNVVKTAGSSVGTINTTFSAPDLAFDYLAEGEQLNITYTVRLNDGAGGTSTQDVIVIVTGSNDRPIYLCGPDLEHLAEDENVTAGNLTADGDLAFADIDLSDTHTVSTTVTAALSGGGLVPISEAELLAALTTSLDDSTGHLLGEVDWSFALANSSVNFLAEGETLTITYEIVVTDAAGGTDTQTVTVIIDGNNELSVNPVTNSLSDTAAVDTGFTNTTGNLLADSGADADPANPVSITAVNGSAANVGVFVAGSYGDLFVDVTGAYVFVANAALDPLQVGDNATEVFTFTVTDSHGEVVTETLTIEIVGADDAPRIVTASALGSVTEDLGPSTAVNGDFETGDLSGWTATTPAITADFSPYGGASGTFAARLGPAPGLETLSQDVATTPGETYTVSFFLSGDTESTTNSVEVFWNGALMVAVADNMSGGLTQYSFTAAANAIDSFTSLAFTYFVDGLGLFLDQVKVEPNAAAPTASTDGFITFTDIETADTHTASFVPQDINYVGVFSLDDSAIGTGTVGWNFTVDNADIQFLSLGQTVTQTYTVFVTDDHGVSAAQEVTVSLNGTNDAPTAVDDTVITNADVSSLILIPYWALAANDTDPDSLDSLSVTNVGGATDGVVVGVSDSALFFEDTTLGGSFTYDATDGLATSTAPAIVTIVNNAAAVTTLTGTGDEDILIGSGGSETLDGGDGNDVLIGNGGADMLTGGTGDDLFGFLQPGDGMDEITDFNNTSEQDQIAISAANFGGGLTAGMDASAVFESSADADFLFAESRFHYDTTTETLYFSADGTTASALALAQFSGVTLGAQDLLLV